MKNVSYYRALIQHLNQPMSIFRSILFVTCTTIVLLTGCGIRKQISNGYGFSKDVNSDLTCDIIRDDSIIVFVEGYSYRSGYEAYQMALQFARIKIAQHLKINGTITLPPLEILKSETLEEIETGKIISQLIVSVNKNRIEVSNDNNETVTYPMMVKDSSVVTIYDVHTINKHIEYDTISEENITQRKTFRNQLEIYKDDIKDTENAETPSKNR